jgi:hypothetical protein
MKVTVEIPIIGHGKLQNNYFYSGFRGFRTLSIVSYSPRTQSFGNCTTTANLGIRIISVLINLNQVFLLVLLMCEWTSMSVQLLTT